eukprot:274917-Amphidinium_carterae.1
MAGRTYRSEGSPSDDPFLMGYRLARSQHNSDTPTIKVISVAQNIPKTKIDFSFCTLQQMYSCFFLERYIGDVSWAHPQKTDVLVFSLLVLDGCLSHWCANIWFEGFDQGWLNGTPQPPTQ